MLLLNILQVLGFRPLGSASQHSIILMPSIKILTKIQEESISTLSSYGLGIDRKLSHNLPFLAAFLTINHLLQDSKKLTKILMKEQKEIQTIYASKEEA